MPGRTLDQMRSFLDRGASVMLDRGRIATSHDQLPTEAQLAKASADPAKIQSAREVLEARKRALDLELAALDEPPPEPAKAEAPAPAPVEPKPAEAPVEVAPIPEPRPEPGVFGKRK